MEDHPSLQGTTCSKLATEAQEQEKTVQDQNAGTATMTMASFYWLL